MKRSTMLAAAAIFLLVLVIVGCNRSTPTPAATEVAAEPTATASPETATPEPTVASAATAAVADPDAVRSALSDTLLMTLQVSVPVTSGVGIDAAYAFPLETADDSVLWLAHTTGIRSFDPEQSHVMAIYALDDNGGWREVARREFLFDNSGDDPTFSPDYLGEAGITQVQIEPDHLWIQAEGGVGAHSGVYGLFSFDGAFFTEQVSGFSSSPGLGRIENLNNDGINEVLLDATDYYVFCYACGVRAVSWSPYRWDGIQMVPVVLTELSAAASEPAQGFNKRLLALAEAGLWKDAQALLAEGGILSYREEALEWNQVYVRVNAEARQEVATGESAYPLLSHVFYGDYAAAVALMDEYGADGLFTPETELITGTVAMNWESELADRLVNNATAALDVQPGLAAAYFVRGWGAYIREYDETAAVADVQRAAELAPDNVLYQKSIEYLTE